MIRVATRGSQQALTQSRIVAAGIEQVGHRCELVVVETAGGGFAAQAAQIIQLGAPHLARRDDLDLVDGGRVNREYTLDADVMVHLRLKRIR